MGKSNIVIHSGKSKKTASENRANFYSSKHGESLMQDSADHQKDLDGVANTLMREALKENRGLNDAEIDLALDNIEVGHTFRPAVRVHSKTSSGVKRFKQGRCAKTGKAIWVPR